MSQVRVTITSGHSGGKSTTELQQWLTTTRAWIQEMQALADRIAEATVKSASVARELLVEYEDPADYIRHHGINTAVFASVIGRSFLYPSAQVKQLALAALVHDVGNNYLPAGLLGKAGPLSEPERERMKLHTRQGADLLRALGQPEEICRVALEHHERLDGSGYPNALQGNAIHPFAQICAVADTFSALVHQRPFRAAFTPEKARERVHALKGQFDPDILKQLLRLD